MTGVRLFPAAPVAAFSSQEEIMLKNKGIFIISLAFLAGLLGGALSNRLLNARIAAAAKTSVANAGKTVRAEKFLVIDEKGKTRAALAYNRSDGTTALEIHDGAGLKRIALKYDGYPDESSLSFIDKGQSIRGLFRFIGYYDETAINFYDGNNKDRVFMDYDGSVDMGGLAFMDDGENGMLTMLHNNAQGITEFRVADKNARAKARLNSSGISFTGETGKVVSFPPVEK
jgi:hypothetical protein